MPRLHAREASRDLLDALTGIFIKSSLNPKTSVPLLRAEVNCEVDENCLKSQVWSWFLSMPNIWQSKASYNSTIKSDHWNNYDRIWSSPTAPTLKIQSIKKSEGGLWSAFPRYINEMPGCSAKEFQLLCEELQKAIKHTDDCTQIRKRLLQTFQLNLHKSALLSPSYFTTGLRRTPFGFLDSLQSPKMSERVPCALWYGLRSSSSVFLFISLLWNRFQESSEWNAPQAGISSPLRCWIFEANLASCIIRIEPVSANIFAAAPLKRQPSGWSRLYECWNPKLLQVAKTFAGHEKTRLWI